MKSDGALRPKHRQRCRLHCEGGRSGRTYRGLQQSIWPGVYHSHLARHEEGHLGATALFTSSEALRQRRRQPREPHRPAHRGGPDAHGLRASKWLNTLYLDKVIDYESIIQAFSRTNRLFGPDKPFGTIRYYRRPHTMKGYIEAAVKLYSGDRPLDMFVQKLPDNIALMDARLQEILMVFEAAGVGDLSELPHRRKPGVSSPRSSSSSTSSSRPRRCRASHGSRTPMNSRRSRKKAS